MTGAPAETWRRFTFSTSPPWAFWIGGLLLSAILARRASGYLPLTRASATRLNAVNWTFAGLILLAFLMWIVAAIVNSVAGDQTSSPAIGALLIIAGAVVLLIGIIGLLIARQVYGPTGRVLEQQYGQYEPVVELRRVHPNFVVAVLQLQQSRTVQFASQAHATFQP